jgi:hypothetical protein
MGNIRRSCQQKIDPHRHLSELSTTVGLEPGSAVGRFEPLPVKKSTQSPIS